MILNLVQTFTSTFMESGSLIVLFMVFDNLSPKISDFLRAKSFFFRFLILSFIMGIVTMTGLLLLIVPGVYFLIRLQFAPFILIDKNCSVIEALKESERLTKGIFFNLLWFDLIMFFFSLSGLLALGIGFLFTKSIATLSYINLYRQLDEHYNGVKKESSAGFGMSGNF
jgi:uncharacterized membrane protein